MPEVCTLLPIFSSFAIHQANESGCAPLSDRVQRMAIHVKQYARVRHRVLSNAQWALLYSIYHPKLRRPCCSVYQARHTAYLAPSPPPIASSFLFLHVINPPPWFRTTFCLITSHHDSSSHSSRIADTRRAT